MLTMFTEAHFPEINNAKRDRTFVDKSFIQWNTTFHFRTKTLDFFVRGFSAALLSIVESLSTLIHTAAGFNRTKQSAIVLPC